MNEQNTSQSQSNSVMSFFRTIYTFFENFKIVYTVVGFCVGIFCVIAANFMDIDFKKIGIPGLNMELVTELEVEEQRVNNLKGLIADIEKNLASCTTRADKTASREPDHDFARQAWHMEYRSCVDAQPFKTLSQLKSELQKYLADVQFK